MKRILYLLIMSAFFFTSCVQEVDDFFDTSSSERVENAVKEYQKILKSAEHGWLMEYYPSSKQLYGGFIFTMKFEDNDQVTVSSEITGDPVEVAKSLYSIKKDIGPTLNFDTYNKIFHYLSDPDPHDPGRYSYFGFLEGMVAGLGYEGDYEFVFREVSDNEIMLRGKKTNNIIRMTKLTEPSDSYITKELAVESQVIFPGCSGYQSTIGGKEAMIVFEGGRGLTFEYDGKTTSISYHYTATGLRFYQPVEVGGRTIQEFIWKKDGRTLTDINSSDVVFTGVMDPDYPKYTKWLGKYSFKYTNNSGAKKTIAVELKEETAMKTYVMEGLPFPVKVLYNREKDMLGISTQAIVGSVNWAVWEVSGDGNLSWGANLGFDLKLVAGSNPETYQFVDNGVWKTYVARAFILWNTSPSGEYKAFGDSRFIDMSLVKSN